MRIIPLLAATLCSSCANLDLPPGCDDVLVARDDEADCESGDRCDFVQDNPQFVARWYLSIGGARQDAGGDDIPYSAAQMAERRNCVADYLDNRGITLIDRGSETLPYVTAEGIAANFDAVLDFEPIDAYQLACSGEVCEHCESLDEDACAADPFCMPVEPTPGAFGCEQQPSSPPEAG